MRSSAIAAFRAIVMLATLTVLLLAAFIYNSPEQRSELLGSIAQSRWLSGTFLADTRGQDDDRLTPASPQPLAEAPPWQPNPAQDVTLPHAAAWSLNADTSQLPGEPGGWPSRALPMAGASAAITRHVPSAVANTADSARLEGVGPICGPGVRSPPLRHDPAVQAAGYEYLPETSSSGHRNGDGVQPPFHSPRATAPRPANELDSHGPDLPGSRGDARIASQSVDGPAEGFGRQETRTDAGGLDRFTRIERRLRELGATYYLLESRGTQSNLFRFHCRMAIGGARHHNRHFEATDNDPLGAMNQVLREVERWRLSRGL